MQAHALDAELAALQDQVKQLRAENARLLRLLELKSQQARPPGPAQAGMFDAPPGAVHAGSPPAAKVTFFGALFAARTDVYAVRWENARSGKSGWMPAVRGGWRKGVPAAEREYLPLTKDVVTAHLSGEVEIGLYPLLDGDRCWWLAADFDGPAAMLDALAYLKAARAVGSPPRWRFPGQAVGRMHGCFSLRLFPRPLRGRWAPGLLREAIALRGRMDLSSYDRLFPSQDMLQTGGLGNLIAAPLQGRSRRRGATVFLDLATLEPHEDQWAYLSSVARLSPREDHPTRQALGPGQCRHVRRPAAARILDTYCCSRPGVRAGAARRENHSGGRRPTPGAAGDAQACGLDAQPAVLRTAAAARLHLGYPPVPAQLRRDPQRRPDPAPRPVFGQVSQLVARLGANSRSATSASQEPPRLSLPRRARS